MPAVSSILPRLALALSAALVAGACADPPPSNYPTQQVYVEDTTLGPGDVFDVRVFRQEDLTGSYSVSSEGTISFPLIGSVAVSGKTPAQVERVITEKLADGYLQNPQVSVFVKEYKSKKISVLGQVRKPGTLPYTEGMTVIEAIAQAGGFTDMARKNAVTVTRQQGPARGPNGDGDGARGPDRGGDGARGPDRDGDATTKYTVPVQSIGDGSASNFYVRPGDVVYVPRRVW